MSLFMRSMRFLAAVFDVRDAAGFIRTVLFGGVVTFITTGSLGVVDLAVWPRVLFALAAFMLVLLALPQLTPYLARVKLWPEMDTPDARRVRELEGEVQKLSLVPDRIAVQAAPNQLRFKFSNLHVRFDAEYVLIFRFTVHNYSLASVTFSGSFTGNLHSEIGGKHLGTGALSTLTLRSNNEGI